MGCTAGFLVGCLSLLATSAPPLDHEVDLELVLAVDASLSMGVSDRAFVRDGYAAALRDAGVVDAITSGTLGRIAVAVVEWRGPGEQEVVVPWTMVSDAPSAERLSAAIAATPLRPKRHGTTAIGDALVFAAGLIRGNAVEGRRRVVDMSGNGASNDGLSLGWARSALVADGITINGLPLAFEHIGSALAASSDRHEPPVELFYRHNVIGGPGSFLIVVEDEADLADALRRKLTAEIAGLPPQPGRGALALAGLRSPSPSGR